MKNLMKSVLCGNSAKFVWKGEIPNSSEDVMNNKPEESSSEFNLDNYTEKRKNNLKVSSSHESQNNSDPIFDRFAFEAEMFSPKETLAALNKHGFKFEGKWISVNGARGKIQLDDNTKGILVLAQTENIIKIIILNKTGEDNVDVFNFETGEVTFDGRSSGMTIPKVQSTNDMIIGGMKLTSLINVREGGTGDWLQNADVPLTPNVRRILSMANSQGYSLQASLSKNGGVLIYNGNKVVSRIDDLENSQTDWLTWTLEELEKQGIK